WDADTSTSLSTGERGKRGSFLFSRHHPRPRSGDLGDQRGRIPRPRSGDLGDQRGHIPQPRSGDLGDQRADTPFKGVG
ncbi:MAG TPA: hypothetical protein VE136_15935, partial [Anaerolineales bacterium]|nr:hypothetical protein [Anaerolineales bacterium]